MTKTAIQPSRTVSDPLSLAHAPLEELVAAIETPEVRSEGEVGLPPKANQIARLIAAEAVRLIRLGTQKEVIDAADDLAQAMVGETADELREAYPDAHRIVNGAAVVLDAAAAPSSSGAEQTVLRSWKGKTMEIVSRLDQAPGRAMRRSDLLDELPMGDAAESSMSHILTSMEAAGLIVRVKHGRNVTVHLGPAGRESHVQEGLATYRATCRQETEVQRFELVREALKSLIEQHLKADDDATFNVDVIPRVEGSDELMRQMRVRCQGAFDDDMSIQPAVTDGEVMCRIRVGDSDDLLCKVRLDGDKLESVQTNSPTGDRRLVQASHRTGLSPSWDFLEMPRVSGRHARVFSVLKDVNNEDDQVLTAEDDSTGGKVVEFLRHRDVA